MLYATVLWQHRKILCDQEAMDREKVNGNHNIGHIRFLVESYRPKYFYFEVIECLRRLLLASVIGIIASEKSSASSLLGLLVSSLFIYVFSKQEPFNIPSDNDLSVVLSYSLMFMFLAALLVKVSVVQDDSRDQQIFGVVLIIIFLAGPASLFVQLMKFFVMKVKQMYTRFKQSRQQPSQTQGIYSSDKEMQRDSDLSKSSIYENEDVNASSMSDKILQFLSVNPSDFSDSTDAIQQYLLGGLPEPSKSSTEDEGGNDGNDFKMPNFTDDNLWGPSSSLTWESKSPTLQRLGSLNFSESNDWLFSQSLPQEFSMPTLTKRMSFSDNSSDVNGIFSWNISTSSIPLESSFFSESSTEYPAKKLEDLGFDISSDHEKKISKTSESRYVVMRDSLLKSASSSTQRVSSLQDGSRSRSPNDSRNLSDMGTNI